MVAMGSRGLAAVAAAFVILVFAGSASASRLSLSQRTFSAVWRVQREPPTEELSIIETFGVTVVCPLTIAGSFHAATIPKVAGTLIGFVNSASFPAECPAVALRETLPWHVRYLSFTGVLPRIASIGISIIGMSFAIPLGECLVRSEAANPARFALNLDGSGVIRTISADTTATIPGSGGCALTSAHLRGTGVVGGVTVRLI